MKKFMALSVRIGACFGLEIIVVSGQIGGSMYVLLEGVCSVLIADPPEGAL